jgi:hypothetical protein
MDELLNQFVALFTLAQGLPPRRQWCHRI